MATRPLSRTLFGIHRLPSFPCDDQARCTVRRCRLRPSPTSATPRAPRGLHGGTGLSNSAPSQRRRRGRGAHARAPSQSQPRVSGDVHAGRRGTGTGFSLTSTSTVIGAAASLRPACSLPGAGHRQRRDPHEFYAPSRRPLAAPARRGEIRSFFAMTSPSLRLIHRLRAPSGARGRHVVINAHKWFSSGAEGAASRLMAAPIPTRRS